MGVASQVPVPPGCHPFQYERPRASFATRRLPEDGISRDCAGQEVMKPDIRKIVAAVDITWLGTGGELEEHGENCALSHSIRSL